MHKKKTAQKKSALCHEHRGHGCAVRAHARSLSPASRLNMAHMNDWNWGAGDEAEDSLVHHARCRAPPARLPRTPRTTHCASGSVWAHTISTGSGRARDGASARWGAPSVQLPRPVALGPHWGWPLSSELDLSVCNGWCWWGALVVVHVLLRRRHLQLVP